MTAPVAAVRSRGREARPRRRLARVFDARTRRRARFIRDRDRRVVRLARDEFRRRAQRAVRGRVESVRRSGVVVSRRARRRRIIHSSFIINHQSSIIARRRVPSRSIAHLFPPSDDARACFVSLVVASFVRSRSVIASKLAASVVGVRARASSSAAAAASRDVVVGSGVTATGERASSASRAGEGADMASTCAANDELAI